MGCSPCGRKFTQSEIQGLLRSAGCPDITVNTSYGSVPLLAVMSAICMGESCGGCSLAINPGVGAGGRRTNEYSVGLFQINTLVHKNYTVEQLKDPAINAKEAVRIYRLQGLRAWGAYSNGSYKRYMGQALSAYKGQASTPISTSPLSNVPNPLPSSSGTATALDTETALLIGATVLTSVIGFIYLRNR